MACKKKPAKKISKPKKKPCKKCKYKTFICQNLGIGGVDKNYCLFLKIFL